LLHIIMSAVNYLLWIIAMLIVVDSIMSWIPGAAGSRFGEMISTLVTPVIAPIRRIFMRFEFARSSPVDFSPMVALIIIFVIQSIISIF
jgi:YggT family protein